MDRVSVSDLCSAARLAQRNHRRRFARRIAVDTAGCSARTALAIGQDREGLAARLTDSPPHPDACMPVVVALTESPAVADDRVVTANGTSPRQQLQRDHPGSMLSFASGSAINRITAGVKARR